MKRTAAVESELAGPHFDLLCFYVHAYLKLEMLDEGWVDFCPVVAKGSQTMRWDGYSSDLRFGRGLRSVKGDMECKRSETRVGSEVGILRQCAFPLDRGRWWARPCSKDLSWLRIRCHISDKRTFFFMSLWTQGGWRLHC